MANTNTKRTYEPYEPDSIQLYDWMWQPSGLGLSLGTIELVLFARIYSFSHHQAGLFYEPASKTAQIMNVSRRSICSAIKSLIDRGLIVQRGTYRHGDNQDCPKYAVNQKAIDAALVAMSENTPRPPSPNPTPTSPTSQNAQNAQCATEDDSCDKTISNEPSRTAALSDHETDESFAALLAIDANGKHESKQATYRAFCKARESYAPDEILAAYEKYLDVYYREHASDGTRYVMRLEKFLSTGKGLFFYAPKRKSRKADKQSSPAFPTTTTCPNCGTVAKHISGEIYDCGTCKVAFRAVLPLARGFESTA